jgi:hypothetical protein
MERKKKGFTQIAADKDADLRRFRRGIVSVSEGLNTAEEQV